MLVPTKKTLNVTKIKTKAYFILSDSYKSQKWTVGKSLLSN